MPKLHHLQHDRDGTEIELPTVSGKTELTTGRKLAYWSGVLLLGLVVALSSNLSRSDNGKGLSLGTGLQRLVPQGKRGCRSVILLN